MLNIFTATLSEIEVKMRFELAAFLNDSENATYVIVKGTAINKKLTNCEILICRCMFNKSCNIKLSLK